MDPYFISCWCLHSYIRVQFLEVLPVLAMMSFNTGRLLFPYCTYSLVSFDILFLGLKLTSFYYLLILRLSTLRIMTDKLVSPFIGLAWHGLVKWEGLSIWAFLLLQPIKNKEYSHPRGNITFLVLWEWCDFFFPDDFSVISRDNLEGNYILKLCRACKLLFCFSQDSLPGRCIVYPCFYTLWVAFSSCHNVAYSQWKHGGLGQA